MRVLLITSKFYGPPWHEGVANIVRRLAQYLLGKNDNVTIICPGRGSSIRHTGEFGEEIQYISLANDLQMWGRSRAWVSMIKRIRSIAEGSTPDVALAFVSASLLLGPRTFVLRSLLGPRIVLYISGLNSPAFGMKWLLQDTKIMVGSPFLLRWFPQATLAYPVTPTHLRPAEVSEAPASARNLLSLLYLGTLQKERGVEYLLKGLAAARQRTRKALKLTMALSRVGDGYNPRILSLHQLRQLIVDLGLKDIVSIHGIVDINEVYRATDVVVIPRQKNIRMSFPVRILESLSYNKPVIVTSMCDMGSLIDDCGLVANPRDPEDLARAIVSLAEDSELYQRLSNNCATVLQKYQPNQTLETIYSVLKGVVDERD